jgi:hypothetical protein
MVTKARIPNSSVPLRSTEHFSFDETMPLMGVHTKVLAIRANHALALPPTQHESADDTEVVKFIAISLSSGLITSVVASSIGLSLATSLIVSLCVGSFSGMAALLVSQSEDFVYTDDGSEKAQSDDTESVLSEPPTKKPAQLEMAQLPTPNLNTPPPFDLTAAINNYESLLKGAELKHRALRRDLSTAYSDMDTRARNFILAFVWDRVVVFQEKEESFEISKSVGAVVFTDDIKLLKQHCSDILASLERNSYLYGKIEAFESDLTHILREYSAYTCRKPMFYI